MKHLFLRHETKVSPAWNKSFIGVEQNGIDVFCCRLLWGFAVVGRYYNSVAGNVALSEAIRVLYVVVVSVGRSVRVVTFNYLILIA